MEENKVKDEENRERIKKFKQDKLNKENEEIKKFINE